MTKEVEEIDVSESTSLEVALLEALGSGTTDVGSNDSDNSNEEPNDDLETDNHTEETIEGIVSDVQEKEPSESSTNERVERETLFFFEINDKTTIGSFRPEDPEQQGRGFPIKASGQVDTMLIVAQDSTFKATLLIDGDKVLDNESWSSLNSISQELAHIGAYSTDSDKYVLSIADYPFNESVDLSIRATEQTTFETIRVELMLDEYTKGPE